MIKGWLCAMDSWGLGNPERDRVAQKGRGRHHQGSGTGVGSWRGRERFEEARDGMGVLFSGKGRGSVIKHRADGTRVCPRRSKQSLSEVRVAKWDGRKADSVPSMMVNSCVILAGLRCQLFGQTSVQMLL